MSFAQAAGGAALVVASLFITTSASQPYAAAGEWLPLPAQSLEVAAGSALDFSFLVPGGVAGSSGPLVQAADGKLRFAKSSDEARFNCGVISNGSNLGQDWPSHAEADRLALQFRRHGYTLVRFHYADMRLKAPASIVDFSVDPVALDRFHYLLAALKRNGIYWMIDGITHPNAGKGTVTWKSPRTPNDIKIRLNFDPVAQTHWLKLVDALYGRVNPYTGMSVLADPALAFVVGANENSIVFWLNVIGGVKPKYPDGLGRSFNQWMRARYRSASALRTALPDANAAELSGRAVIRLPQDLQSDTPRLRLFLRFVTEKEVAAHGWMTQRLRKRGFRGPILGFPEWYAQQDNGSRAQMLVTDLHAYVGEVTQYDEGAKLVLPSSTSAKGLGAWLTNAMGRWLDRPIVFTEYGQPYPNPYRYEAGLFFPALAAFQGYSAICRHAHLSVEPSIPASDTGSPGMRGYSIGVDPIARAGETLSALLFYRKDVAPARGTVAVEFGADKFSRPGSAFFPDDIRKTALLTRFGLVSSGGAPRIEQPAVIISVPSKSYGLGQQIKSRVSALLTSDSGIDIHHVEGVLRAKGILGQDNRTDPAAGVFQSSTGQIILAQKQGMLQVITPRTEAVSITGKGGNIALDALVVREVNSGALVSASSLDGEALAQSRRILFILAGDAVNTGMRLEGTGESRLMKSWGGLPILLQHVIGDVEVRAPDGAMASFSALDLGGRKIGEPQALLARDGKFRIRLDTGAVTDRPTTYFLLERHEN